MLAFTHHEHRARCSLNNMFGDTAKEDMLEAGATVSRDDNKIGWHTAGRLDDFPCWRTNQHKHVCRDFVADFAREVRWKKVYTAEDLSGTAIVQKVAELKESAEAAS